MCTWMLKCSCACIFNAFLIMCSHVYLLWQSFAHMFTCLDDHMLLCSYVLIFTYVYDHMLWQSHAPMSTCFDKNMSICLYVLMLICLDTLMIGCSYVNMLHWLHVFKFTCHDDNVLPCLHALMITYPLAVWLWAHTWEYQFIWASVIEAFQNRSIENNAWMLRWLGNLRYVYFGA